MARELIHEADSSRYTLHVDGKLVALADYVIKGNSISFNHTYTEPRERGHGYAADVVEFAMNDVETASVRTVIPMCWYVAKWFEEHPERENLLRPRLQ